jgi:uncharacterized membrane protein
VKGVAAPDVRLTDVEKQPISTAADRCCTPRLGDNVIVTHTEAQARRDGSPVPVYGMAVSLIGSGIGHFAAPARFDSVVPAELPGDARFYTYTSGVVEVVIGALLLLRRTRRFGGLAALAFFVLISPAIINGVRLSRGKGWRLLVAIARLPLQISMITQAWKISRNA